MAFSWRLGVTAIATLVVGGGLWAGLQVTGTDEGTAVGAAAGLATVIVTLGVAWAAQATGDSAPEAASGSMPVSVSGQVVGEAIAPPLWPMVDLTGAKVNIHVTPAAETEISSPPAVGVPRTGTLKAVTAFFTGRAEQVAAIETLVGEDRNPRDVRVLVVIHGMPGVGKSVLGLHLAHRFVLSFYDRVRAVGWREFACQVDLHGLEGLGTTDPRDALSHLLREVGVAAHRLAPDLEGLAAQWRDHMAGRFLVLLLDNADDDEQVLPFLPGGPGYIVLVTSRRPLQGLVLSRGAATLNLRVMSREEAAQLVMTVTGRTAGGDERRALESITEFCGYHPQAVTIAVAGLAERPDISFEDRLAQLRAIPNRLLAIDDYVSGETGRVAKSFELSYMQLPTDCQLMLRRLGLAPVPVINVEVAAALCEVSVAAAGAHVRLLEREALVQAERAGYYLHDLIRHYARGLADEDAAAENVAAVARVLAYYQRAASDVDAMLTRQPPPQAVKPPTPVLNHTFAAREGTMAWARVELPNFLACADYVARGPGDLRSQQDSWVVMFAEALAGLLRNDGLWSRSIELQTRAVDAAVRLRSPLAEANALHERGLLYRLSGNLPEAVNDLRRALEMYREIGGQSGQTGEAHALNTYAVVLDQLKQSADAADHLSSSLAIYRRLGNRLGESNALHDQGMAKYFSKDYRQAMDLLSQALDGYQDVNHPLGKGHAHSNLAKAQRYAGFGPEAARNLDAAQQQYHELGNRLGEATTLTELGVVLHEEGDLSRAEDALVKSVTLNTQVGNQLGLANALQELGVVRAAAGNRESAEILLKQSLELFRKHGIRRDESGPLEKLSKLGMLDASPANINDL